MTTKLVLDCAILCLATALSGCASLGSAGSSDLLKQIDGNFSGCERHITFQAGVGLVAPGAQVSGSVDCKGGGISNVPAKATPSPANPESAVSM